MSKIADGKITFIMSVMPKTKNFAKRSKEGSMEEAETWRKSLFDTNTAAG